MKKAISMTLAAMMLLTVVFVFASCGGGADGTYKFDKVEIKYNGDDTMASMTDSMKSSMEASYKDATATVKGTTVTLEQGGQKTEIKCTKDGSKLIPENNSELSAGLDALKQMDSNAKLEIYFDTSSGLKLVTSMEMKIMTYQISVEAQVLFKK